MQDVSGTPDFTGELLTGLDVGFYTVVATSRITGCISEPVTGEIIEDLNFPEFNIQITPSTCGVNNGFARLILTNDVEVDEIVWTDASGFQTIGPNLPEALAGFYTVTVTSALGCETLRLIVRSIRSMVYLGMEMVKTIFSKLIVSSNFLITWLKFLTAQVP